MLKPVTTDIDALKILEERLRWLSAGQSTTPTTSARIRTG
jgi:hypothetical protein